MISAFFFNLFVSRFLSLMPTPYICQVTIRSTNNGRPRHHRARERTAERKTKMWIETNDEKSATEAQQKNVKHLDDCGITSNSMEFTANLKLECFSNANIGKNMEKLVNWYCWVYVSGGADDTDKHIEYALAICAPNWNNSKWLQHKN